MTEIRYAREGFAFFRVSTPSVFREYELPVQGELDGKDLERYEELQDLAERHRTSVITSPYNTG